MKSLKELVRRNIWGLKPYSSARDEFHGEASVFLDANESPFHEPYNRYPDPMSWALKEKISKIKGVRPASIFLGNGSDEAIDLSIRIFCEPGRDRILSIEPSYGMYQVAADVNNVECRRVKLGNDFALDADALLDAVDGSTKMIFLCSPNNPTGNVLSRRGIYKILKGFDGIVAIDEAYIDFSSSPSFTRELDDFPNLLLFQTFSKAWAGAGVRLGMAFASEEIIKLFNKVKYPYNINLLTQQFASELLRREDTMKAELLEILNERALIETALHELPYVKKVYPSDANFLLVRLDDADATYNYLVEKGIIVRNRNSITLCEGCLRITIGTPEQNNILLKALQTRKL